MRYGARPRMTEMPPPRLERLEESGPPAGRAALAIAGALVVLVATATLSRISAPRIDAPADAPGIPATGHPAQPMTAEDAGDFVAAPLGAFRIVSPEAGRNQRNDGSIRIAARGGAPNRFVRASVTHGATDLGIATLQSDVRGVTEGTVRLLPIAFPSPVRLSVRDAMRGDLLGEVEFTLDPGLPVSVVSPSREQLGEPTDRLTVFGTTLPDIERVTLRLRQQDELIIVERRVPATRSTWQWRSFGAELELPQERQRQLLWLEVTWKRSASAGDTGRVRIPVLVSSAREQRPGKHPSTAPPP